MKKVNPKFRKPHVYNVGDKAMDRTIERLVRMSGETVNADLVRELFTSVAKIGKSKFTRGELKVINTTLKELRYAFRVFEPYTHIRKVAVFGSARTKETTAIYKSAIQFGKLMAESGWMVITGGSSGIMKAGHEGAGMESSFGLNIRLPFEQEVNQVIKNDRKLIHFKYFFTRKLSFIKESDATVLYPGGFGTHDEGMESLTLSQTGKNNPRPIVVVDTPKGDYWERWFHFVKKALLAGKMIDPDDYELPVLARSPEAASKLVLDFYRVYHSLRYVNEWTVLRLNQDISDVLLKELNLKYSHILTSGKIEKTNALPAESDESEIRNLPRLKMLFNRRNYGTLHRLIRQLNLD